MVIAVVVGSGGNPVAAFNVNASQVDAATPVAGSPGRLFAAAGVCTLIPEQQPQVQLDVPEQVPSQLSLFGIPAPHFPPSMVRVNWPWSGRLGSLSMRAI